MPPIDLKEVDRLARKRFGNTAADILNGLSAAAMFATFPADVVARCVGSIMRGLPQPPRDVPVVYIRDFPAMRLEVPAWLQPPDPVRDYFAKLEQTRPDLFN